MKRFLNVLVFFVAALGTRAQPQSADAPSLKALQFLEGKWVGEGSSEAGHGGGYASFEKDLQGRVILRRNHAEYPAAEGRPAYIHDDLMIIYVDPGPKCIRAFYTDNESHIIHYTVRVSADGNTVIFLGDSEPAAPQYRLSYTRLGENRMSILLEAAQPNDAGHFAKSVEGRMQKAPTTN